MQSESRILLVDDETSVLSALQRFFRRSGYRVTACNSGKEGLVAFETEGPFQLVISDYRMPEMNGVEFLSAVRRRWPDTMRMVLSGFADTSAIISATNEGNIYKFIPKPWDETFLLESVRDALAAHDRNSSVATKLQELCSTLGTLETTHSRDISHHQLALSIYHTLLDQMPVGVIGVDSEYLVVSMNSHAQALLGLSVAPLGEPAVRVLPGVFGEAGPPEPLPECSMLQIGDQEICVLCKKLHKGSAEGMMMILVLVEGREC